MGTIYPDGHDLDRRLVESPYCPSCSAMVDLEDPSDAEIAALGFTPEQYC